MPFPPGFGARSSIRPGILLERIRDAAERLTRPDPTIMTFFGGVVDILILEAGEVKFRQNIDAKPMSKEIKIKKNALLLLMLLLI